MVMQTLKPTRRYGSLITSLILLAIGGIVFWQRYYIFDSIRLWNYTPPAAITQLADETSMLSTTKRVFYAYRPSLDDKSSFNTHCTFDEQTIVLGCYNRRGIYLYQVTDVRLHGVVEVTAAHELLHAEYDRLSTSDKKHVDTMVAAAYQNITDERIRKTIKSYQDNGADVPNEMHSILGTEVQNLPADLEAYYARYFSNRKAIVAFSESYVQEFTARQDQVVAYDTQLAAMKTEIDKTQTDLSKKIAQINAAYSQLQTQKSSGDTVAYNDGVPAYNQSVNAYNGEVKRAQSLINEYNDIVSKRNALAVEENQLSKAIDSRPTTIETQ